MGRLGDPLVCRLVWGLEVLSLTSQGYRAYRLGNLKGERAFPLHLDFLCLLVLRVLGHVLVLKDNIEEAKNV